MQIQSEMTKQDYIDFNLYYQQRSPSLLFIRLLVLIPTGIVTALCAIALLTSGDPLKTAKDIAPLLKGAALPFLAYFFLWRYIIILLVKVHMRQGKNKDVFGPNQIAISPEGISETSATRSNSTSWNSVEKIVVLSKVAYIYVTSSSAHIIPRRTFASDADFKAFVDQAKSYLAQANGR